MTKQKLLLLPFVICISACDSWLPKHEFCVLKSQAVEIVNPATEDLEKREVILGAWCTRTDRNDDPYWKSASYVNKWIARSPRTEQAIIEAAKRNCGK